MQSSAALTDDALQKSVAAVRGGFQVGLRRCRMLQKTVLFQASFVDIHYIDMVNTGNPW